MNPVRIAIDVMGGDHGPSVTIAAALQVLAEHPNLHLLLVGQEDLLTEMLKRFKYDIKRILIVHAPETVLMNESPSQALRLKKNSSMRIAINLVKSGEADACVSAGNTGALMATARFVLKTIPGVDRPAIVSSFPTMAGKKVRMLDLGANVDSSSDHLLQFAVMGSVLASAVDGIFSPKVCLLNIGEEEIKGNDQVKQTASKLSKLSSLNYIGYIEGDDVYEGDVDVVVCDGFVGNVALKSAEGVAVFIGKIIKEAFYKNIFTKIVGLIAKPVLRAVIKRIDPDQYNGASLLGLQGIVVKSHGGASISAFACAIKQAMLEVQCDIPLRIRHEVSQLLGSANSANE